MMGVYARQVNKTGGVGARKTIPARIMQPIRRSEVLSHTAMMEMAHDGRHSGKQLPPL
jgi:hypothetical protein